MFGSDNLPEYEREYRKAKRNRTVTKWIGRLISCAFLPILIGTCVAVSNDPDDRSAILMLGFTVLFYGAYWTWGTFIRFLKRNKQMKKLRAAILKKAAYEEGLMNCENFYFDNTRGLPDDLLFDSGLLLPTEQSAASLVLTIGNMRGDTNSEYMSGIINGIPFERATVDLTPGSIAFEVNWMVFRLPYNTMTSMRFMSGRFAEKNLKSGILGEPFCTGPNGYGGLYHIAGEVPSEDIKNLVLGIAGNIGDDCEILVLGDRLHVLLKREGYMPRLTETIGISEETIRQQVAGRISELRQCTDSMNISLTAGAAAAQTAVTSGGMPAGTRLQR